MLIIIYLDKHKYKIKKYFIINIINRILYTKHHLLSPTLNNVNGIPICNTPGKTYDWYVVIIIVVT